MKIEQKNIKVAELFNGYSDKGDEGVVGYGGKLNIRPAYQREFIYKDKQRDEVIRTVLKGYPLNVMYWAVAGDGYELMDGQQRTISLCQYLNNDFSIEVNGSTLLFHSLTTDIREQLLNYELMIYVCDGPPSEKLEWFKIINIAGEKLTDQELRNAMYTGTWLSAAKKYFSKVNGPAEKVGEGYLKGNVKRQECLETAIDWVSGGQIENYMTTHQHNPDAEEIWMHFREVIDWVKRIFPNYRADMKGLDWGRLFALYKDKKVNPQEFEARIASLMEDEEVSNKKGIYEYLLSGDEKTLNLREFPDKIKKAKYESQKGICPMCSKHFEFNEMEADHIVPWSKGGKTDAGNCQMLCRYDNRTKSGN